MREWILSLADKRPVLATVTGDFAVYTPVIDPAGHVQVNSLNSNGQITMAENEVEQL